MTSVRGVSRMSRYIDADALIEKIDDIWANRSLSFLGARILTMIDNEPHIDIVRCGECKYYEAKEDWCYWRDEAITADDFCSYGEREGE